MANEDDIRGAIQTLLAKGATREDIAALSTQDKQRVVDAYRTSRAKQQAGALTGYDPRKSGMMRPDESIDTSERPPRQTNVPSPQEIAQRSHTAPQGAPAGSYQPPPRDDFALTPERRLEIDNLEHPASRQLREQYHEEPPGTFAAMGRGAGNAVTAGGMDATVGLVRGLAGDKGDYGHRIGNAVDLEQLRSRAAEEQHPAATGLGEAATLAGGGIPAAVDEIGARAGTRVAKALGLELTGVPGSIARGAGRVVRGAAGGAVSEAGRALAERTGHEDFWQALRESAPYAQAGAQGGAVAGGIGHVVTEAGSIPARVGQARRDVETVASRKGTIGMFKGPHGGEFDKPPVPPSNAEIGAADRSVARTVLKDTDKRADDLGGQLKTGRGAWERVHGNDPMDATRLYTSADKVINSNRSSAGAIATARELQKRLGKYARPNGTFIAPTYEVNELRAFLDRESNAHVVGGQNIHDPQIGALHGDAKDILYGIPGARRPAQEELHRINSEYAAGMEALRRNQANLGVGAREGLRPVEKDTERKAALFLGGASKGPAAGSSGVRGPDIADLTQDNPHLADTIGAPAKLRAKQKIITERNAETEAARDRLTFGTPRLSLGSPGAAAAGALHSNFEPFAVRLMEPFSRGAGAAIRRSATARSNPIADAAASAATIARQTKDAVMRLKREADERDATSRK